MRKFKGGQIPQFGGHYFLFILLSLTVALISTLTVFSTPSFANCCEEIPSGFWENPCADTSDLPAMNLFLCQDELMGNFFPNEMCDVANTMCIAAATCGDGNVDSGEDCDDMGESATCDADCTAAMCGDGTLNVTAGEECDDGNMVDGDGCSMTCTAECDIQSLIDLSEDLEFLGVPGAQGLKPKLKNAQMNLDQGDISGACDKLQAFINYVRAMVASGRLVPPTGQEMIEGAEACRTANGC